MDAETLPASSWGKPSEQVDVRALRRYGVLLRQIGSVGEGVVFVLLACIAVSTAVLVTQTNFEDAIFDDGTDFRCLLDGRTGEIKNVE